MGKSPFLLGIIMAGFNYKYTCGDIDGFIDETKTALENLLDTVLDECSPMFDGQPRTAYIAEKVAGTYKEIETHFEGVRTSNENMRDAADEQITDLENDKEQLQLEIDNHECTTTED